MAKRKQSQNAELTWVLIAGGISTVVALLALSSPSKVQVIGLGVVGVLTFSGAVAARGISAPYGLGKLVKGVLLLLLFMVVMAPFCWIAWPQDRSHIHIIGFHRVQGYAPYDPNAPVQIEVGVMNDGKLDAKMTAYYRAQFLPHPKTDVGTSLEDKFFEQAIKDARPAGILPGDITEVSRGQGVQTIISSMPLRPEEIAALQEKRVSLYFAGRILYDDSSDQASSFVGARHTDFCVHLGAQPGNVTLCRDHREEP